MSQNHINTIKDFFNREGLPIPKGFTDEDVNLGAPRLYTDSFALFYLAIMSRYAMGAYGLAYHNVARVDIRNYFSECIKTLMDMHEKIADTLLNMGVFVKAPHVEVAKEISFINDNGFLDGILSKQRSIFSVEILHVFNNIITNTMARTLVTGFGQVANTIQVQNHMFNKLDTLNDHIETLGKVLSRENIPVPYSSDTGLTDSTIAPFSDKLMMFHSTAMLGNIIIANYGTAVGSSLRTDLLSNYIKFTAEISKHAKAGVDIMIENKWLEQPPQVVNHENLLKV
jgi:hypothetical protein